MLPICFLPSCFPSVGGIVFSVSEVAVAFLPESVFVVFFSFLGLGFANLALFRRYCTSLSRAAIFNSTSFDSRTGFSVGESLFCSASVSFFQICGMGGKRCFLNASGFQEPLLPATFPPASWLPDIGQNKETKSSKPSGCF